MLHFENDYNKGAHPELLNALIETNDQGLSGYGTDSYCQQAADKIREVCSCPQAEVEFLVGGTQTNQVVISSMLASYEGVIAAETGHVSSHEAGAIEFSGHKVLTLPSHNGKLLASEVATYIETFYADGNYQHMVFPGMVYISHPTEYGTLYSKAELGIDMVWLRKIQMLISQRLQPYQMFFTLVEPKWGLLLGKQLFSQRKIVQNSLLQL